MGSLRREKGAGRARCIAVFTFLLFLSLAVPGMASSLSEQSTSGSQEALESSDRTPPELTLSGTMTEQGTLGTKWPSYELKVEASDGSAKDPQSGVAKTAIELDGKIVNEAAPGCKTENCSITREWTLESSKYSIGSHTVEVSATDGAGLTATKTLKIELEHAPPPASVSASSPKGGLALLSASTGSEIGVLPTLDPLNRTESPLSNSGKWSALAWDNSTSGHNTGRDTTSGWGPYDAYSTINGAYWNPSTFRDKTGSAAAITMQTSPGSAGRYVALWLDMSSPGSAKTGYQLRWTVNSGSSYTVKLSKWSAGQPTSVKATGAWKNRPVPGPRHSPTTPPGVNSNPTSPAKVRRYPPSKPPTAKPLAGRSARGSSAKEHAKALIPNG